MTDDSQFDLDFDFDFDFGDNTESADKLEARDSALENKLYWRKVKKRTQQRVRKRTALKKWLTRIPDIGESLHIVSDARYDFWTWIPVIQSLLNCPVEFWGSTWTMNRENVLELFELFDDGKIKEIHILTGLYFKRRESAVYATLLEGMRRRGQRYIAFKNHTKIMLMTDGQNYLTIEGSANFTSNPRKEQFVFSNDKGLFMFHADWFNEAFNNPKDAF